MLVSDVILLALKMTGEYDPQERPDGEFVNETFQHLQLLFDEFASSGVYIPYISRLDFAIQQDQDTYTVSKKSGADIDSRPIIELDFVDILYAEQSIPLKQYTQAEYYNRHKIFSYKRRPYAVLLENQPAESILKFYPIPDRNYDCVVKAKFDLSDITQQTQIEDILPRYYNKFLVYSLARIMVDVFKSGDWSDRQEVEYQKMFDNISRANEADYNLNVSSSLLGRAGRFPYYDYYDGYIR